MSKLLESLDVLWLAGGQFGQWKTEEIMLVGCRGSECVMKKINPNSSEGIHRLLFILVAYIHAL